MKLEISFKSCLIAFIGSAILAFGLYNIHSLSDISEGGVLGLTLLLKHWFDISPALSSFILDVFCYMLGFKTLGKEFLVLSVFASGGFSLCYCVFEQFPPIYPQIAEHPLLAAICGALFVGIGAGLAVRAGGAPGGDDALAMSLSKIFNANIRWIYLISDVSVLLLSLTYIPFTKIMYSLLTVILSGQILGFVKDFKLKKNNR